APGWQLIALEPRQAVFEGPGGRKTLELRVFDGRGEQATTALMASAPIQAPSRSSSSTPDTAPLPFAPDSPPPTPAANADTKPARPVVPRFPDTSRSSDERAQAMRGRAEARRIEARRAQLRREND